LNATFFGRAEATDRADVLGFQQQRKSTRVNLFLGPRRSAYRLMEPTNIPAVLWNNHIDSA